MIDVNSFKINIVLRRLICIGLLIISSIQLLFISIASHSAKDLPIATLLLVWLLKIPLLCIFFSTLISIFISNNIALRVIIFSAFLVSFFHMVLFFALKILPFGESGSVLYVFFFAYVLFAAILIKQSPFPSSPKHAIFNARRQF